MNLFLKSNKLTLIISITFLSLFVNTALFSLPQKSTAKSLSVDSLLSIIDSNAKSMGSLSISKADQIIYHKAIGFRKLDNKENIPIDTNTKFRIGSISKMFTSVITIQLIEEGKLSFDTKLSRYYPEIPKADSITIAMMLNHHSGIYSFTDDPDYLKWCTKKKSQKDIINIVKKNNPRFSPNAKGEYSNSNFVLLGYIIEKIEGQPYSAVLEKRITKPLALNNTCYGKNINEKNNEAFSYTKINNWQKDIETDMSIPHGAGAIISTSDDLCKFANALFQGRLISNNNLKLMTEMKDGFGYGIFKLKLNEKEAFGHSGGIDSFTSFLAYSPESQICGVYLSNGTSFPSSDIVKTALSIYTDQPYAMPVFKKAIKLDNYTDYTGNFASDKINLRIKLFVEKDQLFAQADGQQAFPLEAFEKDIFRFEPANIIISFNEQKSAFTLKQSGMDFLFTKQ
jgi:CubicO group peptidase (beta-lactamase class C family)